jgi:ABC-type microcin C transport system permease subunit YejE
MTPVLLATFFIGVFLGGFVGMFGFAMAVMAKRNVNDMPEVPMSG